MARRLNTTGATPLAHHLTTSLIVVVLFLCLSGLAVAESVREVTIKVEGMFCPFCTFGIEKRLKLLPETASVRTDLAAGEAVVTLTPEAVFVEDHFADAIQRAGFTHAGPRRIEMQISNQFQKIGFVFTHHRLVVILEQVATPVMTAIRHFRISS